jgi:hypothetical protein
MLFNVRFAFVAGILMLLAMPRPPVRAALAQVVPVVVSVVFAATTCAAWIAFDRVELDGLGASLRAVPRPARVIGLDFVKRTDLLDGDPFFQAFAWRQALYGGELSFTFAEHQSGIVSLRRRRPREWTPGLEWFAERVSLRDLSHFDLALVVGTDAQHERFAQWAGAEPLTERGRIRLYDVSRGGVHP